MTEKEYMSKNESIVLGVVILIIISSYLTLLQKSEVNDDFLGAYFIGIFLGYWPTHNFIFKRNIYFGGFVATPEEKYKTHRVCGFLIGISFIIYCLLSIFPI